MFEKVISTNSSKVIIEDHKFLLGLTSIVCLMLSGCDLELPKESLQTTTGTQKTPSAMISGDTNADTIVDVSAGSVNFTDTTFSTYDVLSNLEQNLSEHELDNVQWTSEFGPTAEFVPENMSPEAEAALPSIAVETDVSSSVDQKPSDRESGNVQPPLVVGPTAESVPENTLAVAEAALPSTEAPIMTEFTQTSDTEATESDQSTRLTQIIPPGHGAWVYHDYVDEISQYNKQKNTNRIRNIYLSSGEVNVTCENIIQCERVDFNAYYYADRELVRKFQESADDVQIVPTLDGRVGTEYLTNAFNNLLDQQALWLALEVGEAYCPEDISGIQVDIEPYRGNTEDGEGQLLFYKHLSDVLAGKHDGYTDEYITTPIDCVNELHAEGRFFSVFMSAKNVDPILADILRGNNNGFVQVSGYDITVMDVPISDGVVTVDFADPTKYKSALIGSIRAIQAAEVPFKVGLPFAASWAEFETAVTDNGTITGYRQTEYIEAAIDAFYETDICGDDLFLGISVWGFANSYAFHGFQAVMPNIAQPDSLLILGDFSCSDRF